MGCLHRPLEQCGGSVVESLTGDQGVADSSLNGGSGSVVESLNRDQGVVGSSLSGGPALCL